MKKVLIFLFFLIACKFNFNYGKTINSSSLFKMESYIDMEDYTNAKRFIDRIDFTGLDRKQKAIVYNKIGFIYYKLKRYRNAFKNYLNALKYNNKLYYVYNNIGILYFHWNEYNNAKKNYLKALQLNNNYPKVLINLAIVDFYLGNYEDAYQWYKKAKSIDKNYVSKRFNKKKGIKKLRELAKKHPEDKELQKLLKIALEYYQKTELVE